jgi:glyoxylase-like metal-dependent hydrolase (beta-lactamase superfamily II)
MFYEQREDVMVDYEIYALKYAGPFVRTGAHLLWYRDWDRIEKINYYIWCIKGAGATVVVDAGVTPELFPAAAFYIQEDEYRFWLEDPVAARPPFRHVSDPASTAYLASLEGTQRLVLLKGDQQILPGIQCLLSPGHTVALQTVAVETARGTAVIGSDCAHVFRNYREDWPSALIVDLVGWMKTYDKLRRTASSPDLLFPGHDRLLLENYPAVAKDVTRLV